MRTSEKIEQIRKSTKIISSLFNEIKPKIGIILGSGLSGFENSLQNIKTLNYRELPGFPEISVQGHLGKIILGEINKIPIICLSGRAHSYEGKFTSMVTPIRTLKSLGCEIIIATNAAGGLVPSYVPGDLMLISDHINLQPGNPLVGPNTEEFGPRFPDLSDAYDYKLRELMKKCAKSLSIKLHEGIYLACLGPNFETPAEISAFQTLGAHAVGMSTVPEVIVARHCNIKIIALSTITNLAAGMNKGPLSHDETLRFAKVGSEKLIKLCHEFIRNINI